ncbi:dihydrofolate reductase [Pyrus x bretschneideri]|uniref:dihydrofolate reductase n=1 Tax=Pyrus x bretschneideri TaxID=225117 RepID=UPI00202E7709|nr:dihydrofolate reductase [Pyrus x bretschneideri]
MTSSATSNTVVVHIEFDRGRFPPDVVNVKTALQPAPFKSSQIQHAFYPSSHTTGAAKKNNKSLVDRSEYSSSPYYLRKTAENMGSQGSGEGGGCSRKPRFLCLHGFRTSGEIMRKQVGKWPESVLEKLDMVYLDGPFPAQGKSDVDGIFDPPYYEWFQFNQEFSAYTNFDKCLEYIEDYMIKQGPFDGLVGFSQGAILSAGLPGLQAKGVALTKAPKIKFLIIIGGAKFNSPAVAEDAYSSPIQCPSLHFLGEMDFLKPYGLQLLEHCVDASVIHHPKGHTVPRLDEKGLDTMMNFIDKIQNILAEKDS